MASLAGNLNKDEQQFAGEALEDEALSQKGAKRSAIENPPTDEPAVAKRRGPLKNIGQKIINAKLALQREKELLGKVSTPHSTEGKKKSELLKFQSKVKDHYATHATSLKEQEVKDDGTASPVPEHKYYIQHLEEYYEFTTEQDEPLIQLFPYIANPDASMEQRRIIIYYLVKVGIKLDLSSYVIYSAVKLMDVFLSKIAVEVKYVQMIGVVCIWIVMKFITLVTHVPRASYMLRYAGGYTLECFLQCERDILSALGFKVNTADPYSLLAFNITKLAMIKDCRDLSHADLYYCSSYMIDLSMFDRHLSFLPIELVVRMALVMGLRAVLNQRGFEGRFESIKKNLDKILRPLTASEDALIHQNFAKLLRKISTSLIQGEKKDYTSVVFKKYSNKGRYRNVSEIIMENLK